MRKEGKQSAGQVWVKWVPYGCNRYKKALDVGRRW